MRTCQSTFFDGYLNKRFSRYSILSQFINVVTSKKQVHDLYYQFLNVDLDADVFIHDKNEFGDAREKGHAILDNLIIL